MAPKLGRNNMNLVLQPVGTAAAAGVELARPPALKTSADFPLLMEVELDRVMVGGPHQPRRHFDPDKLRSLADSIAQHGLKQPVLVIDQGDGRFVLAAGERRYRAHQLLEKPTIFAIVTKGDASELALIENLQREDLDALEVADGLARLAQEKGYTTVALAGVIGRSQAEVSRILSLTRLPAKVRDEYTTSYRTVPKSILMEIAAVADPDRQLALWEEAKAGLTVKAMRDAKKAATPVKGHDRHREGDGLPKVERDLVAGLDQVARALSGVRHRRHTLSDDSLEQLLAVRDQIDETLAAPADDAP
ncbi:ParB/RepB/Spo0J family partition protein [Azospirillum sp.]|uniref:ParB/RepB/Spo0J family partition protein n=1 Tax=Azospirillum sp. TaxID=34012 RepID=UPI002D4AFB22|nr:ParB/RepB/Spo0J family partition protein [Azospirillum sp.]HYD70465.1 ParB/RepB/Spo0J family partition protein [Azospirillum sp.]